MVIIGTPTAEELYNAFQIILAEYLDLNQDNEVQYTYDLHRKIAVLQNRLTESETAIYWLRDNPDEFQRQELIQILRQHQFRLSNTFETDHAFQMALKRIEASFAPLRLQLSTMASDLEKLNKPGEEKTLPDDYFDKMIVKVERYMGIAVDETQISVRKFVFRLRECIESSQKQQEKGNSNDYQSNA